MKIVSLSPNALSIQLELAPAVGRIRRRKVFCFRLPPSGSVDLCEQLKCSRLVAAQHIAKSKSLGNFLKRRLIKVI